MKERDLFYMKYVVGCVNDNYNIHSCNVPVDSNNLTFQMPQFKGMSCYEIAHRSTTVGLEVSNCNYKYKQRVEKDTRKKNENLFGHHVASYLSELKMYGFDPRRGRIKRNTTVKMILMMKDLHRNN